MCNRADTAGDNPGAEAASAAAACQFVADITAASIAVTSSRAWPSN